VKASRYVRAMGLLGRIAGLFRPASRASAPEGTQLEGGVLVPSTGFGGPPARGTRELIAAYKTEPWLRAVTGRIARGVAAATWTVYARSSTPAPTSNARSRGRRGPAGRFRDVAMAPAWGWGSERGVADRWLARGAAPARAKRRLELAAEGLLRELSDHPMLDLLAAPNEYMTGLAALQLTQVWLDIKGEAFWLLAFGADGQPSAFYPLPPHWVTATPTAATPWFQVSYAGVQLRVAPKAMIWLRDPDPENPYARGTGIAEALGDELETDEFAAKYLKAWFFNNAMPAFIVSFDGAEPAQVKRAKEVWESEHRGVHNSHRAHFSTGKMNAVRLDASFRDQQIIDLRKLSRDTLAQVFAMPPEVIGIIENSNRSTIDAARYIYVLGVEYPRVEFLRSELQAQYVPLWDEALALECEVDVPEDEAARTAVMRALPGAFELNEWREEAGYAPLPQFVGRFPPLAQPGQQQDPPPEKPAEKPMMDPEEEPADGETELEPKPARGDPPWARAWADDVRAVAARRNGT